VLISKGRPGLDALFKLLTMTLSGAAGRRGVAWQILTH
jgi:hypothetical protein